MSREAIEKAIKEAEAELALTQGDVWCSGPVTREVWRANVLRSLVDAVLEEAAKACDSLAKRTRSAAGELVNAYEGSQDAVDEAEYMASEVTGMQRCSEAIRALKSQEAAKP